MSSPMIGKKLVLINWIILKIFKTLYYECVCEGAKGGYKSKKGLSYPLELELELVVSLLVWVLGTKLGPLQEQQMFLTTEQPLQPLIS
jgi:hypothetical protein